MSAYQVLHLMLPTVIATDTTTTSIAAKPFTNLPQHANQLCAISTVTSRTDGTYTTTLQHSPDGTNYFTLAAGTAQSANGLVAITVASTVTNFQFVRASVVSTGTTTGATVTVDLYYGEQRKN